VVLFLNQHLIRYTQDIYALNVGKINMPKILSQARSDYKCSECKLWIRKGTKYLNKPAYSFGATKYCIDCIKREVDDDKI